MPNWCYNKMTVFTDEAHADELARFIDMITIPEDERGEGDGWNTPQEYSLVRLMPMPSILEGTISPTPDSPDPHPNWANLLANGEITQEWHDELVQGNIDRYNEGVRVKALTGYTSWYSWQHANWGIKWGDIRTEVDDRDETTVMLSYETPWAPFGDNFMAHVSDLFPNLTFGIMMTEEANFFAGADKWVNGEKVSVDVDIEAIISSFPEEPDDPEESYLRWHEINDSIHEAAESAASTLGF